MSPFTITTDPVNAAPIITSFTPTAGAAGTAVTITGNYFDTVTVNNALKFNTIPTSTTTSTKTQISTVVPANTTSGKLSVRTPYGLATSTQDFFIPPSGYTAAQIGATGRISIDGVSAAINTGTAGNIGMMLFDGSQGQNLGLGINVATFTPAASGTLRILTPQGTDLMTAQSFSAGTSFDLPVLPSTGTYTILLIPPTTSSLAATLTLSTDISGTLVADGAAQSFTTARVGQNALYSFTATAGQNIGVTLSNVTIPGSNVYLLDPNGVTLASGSITTTGGALPVTTLPLTGVYTVFVSPTGTNLGAMTLQVGSPDLTVSALTIPATAIAPNANGSYTFPVSFTVANGGSTPAQPTWYDRVYLPSDAVWDANDAQLSANYQTTAVAAGGAYTLSPSVTTATTVVPGSYYLIVIADQNGYLSEANETNNTRISATQVSLLTRPDLTVSALTIPATAIAPNANGSYTFPVSFTIANGGSTPAQPTWYDRVYLPSDAVWDANDAQLSANYQTTAVAAGGEYTLSPSVTTATTVVPGSYYLIVIADQNGYLAEANETNNTRVSATKATLAP